MENRITFQFKKHGYEVVGEVGDNALFVDLGNCLTKGIIDHHQIRKNNVKNERQSTVGIFDIKYLEHLIGNDSVVIYTHTQPDCDAILSTYMAKMAIVDGEKKYNSVFSKDKYGYKLIEYVDNIDRGFGKNIIPNSDKASFYVAVCYLDKIACALSYLRTHDSLDDFDYIDFSKSLDSKGRTECDQLILKVGHKLIEIALIHLKKNSNCEISNQPIEWNSFIENATVSKYISDLYKADHDIYLEEKETSVNFEDIYVWGRNNSVYANKVKAAIWREIPVSEFSYLYARQEDDAFITVIPINIKEKSAAEKPYTRVIISADPENAISKDITLKPLAEALELIEQIEEYALYNELGYWRRDHSRYRKGFDVSPFVSTADPWFFTEDELLVEDPGKHSIIEYNNIISLIERHTNLISSLCSKEYRDGYLSSCIENGQMTISMWIDRVTELISDHQLDNSFDIFVTEVDAVMIKSRNDVLRALCMSVLGNNIFENKNALELDYYTYMYASENFMLTIMANSGAGADTGIKGRRLYSIIEKGTDDYMKAIANTISEIAVTTVKQRDLLFEISNSIEQCVGNPANSRNLYRRYVKYLASEQSDSMISNLTKQEIYDYLRSMLKIDEAKESIQDTVDIVTSDSKERVYSIFNFLTAITVPFVIISTFFQMGMIQLSPFISDGGFNWSVLWKWLVVIAIAAISCVFVFKRSKK